MVTSRAHAQSSMAAPTPPSASKKTNPHEIALFAGGGADGIAPPGTIGGALRRGGLGVRSGNGSRGGAGGVGGGGWGGAETCTSAV